MSYEVPRAICVLVPVILAGTLNPNAIGRQQAGFLWNWYVFHDPFTFVAFFIFFTCATASCRSDAPFDLAEAEERIGRRVSHRIQRAAAPGLFFMAEYGAMFAVSGDLRRFSSPRWLALRTDPWRPERHARRRGRSAGSWATSSMPPVFIAQGAGSSCL